MKVMLVAGELSGDLHGAYLAKALQEAEPGIQLLGMGGSMMEAAGVRLLFDPTKITVMGFVEVLKGLRLFSRLLREMVQALEKEKPDVLVLIDFPGFNMRLAKMAHEKGFPVVYYFSPSAWAWGRGRAKKLARWVTRIISVFPFEAQVYREAGAEVTYVGHPLVDITRANSPAVTGESPLVSPGQHPVIGLLPGSRQQEIRSLLPPLLEAAARIREEFPAAAFLLPVAPSIEVADLEPFLSRSTVPVTLVHGRTYEVMQAADLLLIASGTATLEAACFGTPMIVVYRLSPLSYYLARFLVKIPYISLPNIVAGEKVVPELIQDQARGERIAAEALALLREPTKLAEMRENLRKTAQKLGQPGAVGRAAAVVLEVGQRYRRSGHGHPHHRQ